MLPNRFPDDGSAPTEEDYDNADGTVCYVFEFPFPRPNSRNKKLGHDLANDCCNVF